MDTIKNFNSSKRQSFDWYKISKKGSAISKILLIIFILCIVVVATFQFIGYPYSMFVAGLELSLAFITVFTIIRMSIYKPVKPYDFDRLKNQNEPIKHLLTKINVDIAGYEEGASYFFNGVRFYKYSTIVLAGISTIILGLDLNNNGDLIVLGNMSYTTFAKNIALIIGAIITISTSLMTYWNIEKYWLTNKTIVNKLRALRDDIESDFVSGKLNNNEAKIQEKIAEYRRIKGDFYKYWEGALGDRGSQSGQGIAASNN